MKEININEYIPYNSPDESFKDCVLRVNKFHNVDICPYDEIILESLIKELKELNMGVSEEYLITRYNQQCPFFTHKQRQVGEIFIDNGIELEVHLAGNDSFSRCVGCYYDNPLKSKCRNLKRVSECAGHRTHNGVDLIYKLSK